ncbi:MAG: tetratricopeptide repeat protein [Phycisphaerales bacterium]|nr:tetratricopeptide repeat protein [Phycisphaerales bacterium]
MESSRVAASSRLACMLVAAVVLATGTPGLAAPDDVKTLYAANGLLERGLYDLALSEYDTFLAGDPAPADALTASYGRAVCLFRLDNLEEADMALAALAREKDFEFEQDVLFLLAHCQVRRGEPGDAVTGLDRMLKGAGDHPSAPEARVLLVEALHRAGEHERVEREAERVLGSERDGARRNRVLLFRGLSALASDEPSDAAEHFRAIVDSGVEDGLAGQARLLLAESLVGADEDDDAARWFEDVIEREEDATLSRALYGLGAVRFRDDDMPGATKVLDRLLEDLPRSGEADAARLLRGRIALNASELDRAEDLFEAVQQGKHKDLEDDAAYWLAKVELRRDRPEGAESTLTQALDSYPDSPLAPAMAFDRAVALSRMGEGERAMTAFADFARLHPRHELADEAVYHVASLLHDAGEYGDSLEALDILAERYKGGNDPGASLFLAAENKYMLEMYDRAADDYERFVSTYADHRQADAARFRLGMCLARLDRFEEAEALLTEAGGEAEAQPMFRSAFLMLGDGYFDAERWADAEAALSTYVSGADDTTPNVDDALIQLALARSRQQDFTGAIEALDALLQRGVSVHYAHALFERGQALMGMKAWDEAGENFERLLQEAPRSRFVPFARRHMASLAQRRGDLERAAELYAEASESGEGRFASDTSIDRAGILIELGRDDEALKLLDEVETTSSSDVDGARLRALRVIAYSRLERCPDAVSLAGRMTDGERAELDPALRDSLVYETARCFRELARTREARDALDLLIDEGTEPQLVVHAMLDVAAMDMEEGDHAAAVVRLDQLDERLERMGDQAPRDLRGHAAYRRGVCAFETGEHQAAIAALDDFTERFPESSLAGSADLVCGESMMETGRHADAIPHLRAAANEKWSRQVASSALLRLGEAHAALQQWALSEDACREFLDRFGDADLWFHARFGLGWARENQGRRAEAIEAYREVVAAHEGPTAARAQFQIGECLYADDKYDEAIRELLRVDILYAYPEWSAAALYEAGRCFEALGRSSEAREQYGQVVSRFGETSWATLASERLKILTPEGVPGHRSS